MKLRCPDFYAVYTETERLSGKAAPEAVQRDVRLRLSMQAEALKVKIAAPKTPLKYIRLRWNFAEEEKRREIVRIYGDAYERGYGDLHWGGIDPERVMPWYMLVSNGTDQDRETAGRYTEGFGVKVRCAAMVTWQYDSCGVTMWADIRNGGEGVRLGERELTVCEVLFGDYRDVSAFEAGRAFCRAMCPESRLPDHKVYGSNNWYYAYGKSSHEEILRDTQIVAEQCEGLENRPYMVIDDGWEKNDCDGPWIPREGKFPDMKRLADDMRALGVRPGIWVRYLSNRSYEVTELGEECRLMREDTFFDPSHPAVMAYVRRTTAMLRAWGYELIKHDFATFDIFGLWGFQMNGYGKPNQITEDGWHFYDRSRTSAEIVVDFYTAIREEAGDDCVIIGCNTISHLCAGLYELNRTGDDTSGLAWSRTRRMGVNTLAFRGIQNGIFYMCDADCVGITGKVPWVLNRRWLDVLSRSGSPLFVSCKPGVLKENELQELKAAWRVNSVQDNEQIPLDWMENVFPERWLIDGEEVRYSWYDEEGVDSFNPN